MLIICLLQASGATLISTNSIKQPAGMPLTYCFAEACLSHFQHHHIALEHLNDFNQRLLITFALSVLTYLNSALMLSFLLHLS
jgi:hypothetical protein